MSKRKRMSLRRNFVWAFIGNVVSAFCMWLLLVLLVKMASVETVGDFGVAQAIGLPISMLFSLKLQLAQVTDAKEEFDFGHYYALRLITSIATVVVIAAIGFFIYEFDTALIITSLGIGYAIMAIREIFLGVLQKYERMDLTAGSRIFQGLFSLVLFGCLFWFTKNLAYAIFGLVIARIIVLLFYDLPTARKLLRKNGYIQAIAPRWHMDKVWLLVKTTSPLGVVAWLATLFNSLPRFFLDEHVGRTGVGFFTAMSSLLVAGTMVVAALVQAVSPRLSQYYVENMMAYKALLLKLFLVGIGLSVSGLIVAVFAGKMILTVLFQPEYAEHSDVFVILVIAGSLLTLLYFMNLGLTAARKFLVQVPLYTGSVIACGISSFCLIPHFGMTGAAVSLIICHLTGLIGCGYYLTKVIKSV